MPTDYRAALSTSIDDYFSNTDIGKALVQSVGIPWAYWGIANGYGKFHQPDVENVRQKVQWAYDNAVNNSGFTPEQAFTGASNYFVILMREWIGRYNDAQVQGREYLANVAKTQAFMSAAAGIILGIAVGSLSVEGGAALGTVAAGGINAAISGPTQQLISDSADNAPISTAVNPLLPPPAPAATVADSAAPATATGLAAKLAKAVGLPATAAATWGIIAAVVGLAGWLLYEISKSLSKKKRP